MVYLVLDADGYAVAEEYDNYEAALAHAQRINGCVTE
jgi:hypothetical protein